ncbi:unnamed protein product, partial [marine sediment metagenome]
LLNVAQKLKRREYRVDPNWDIMNDDNYYSIKQTMMSASIPRQTWNNLRPKMLRLYKVGTQQAYADLFELMASNDSFVQNMHTDMFQNYREGISGLRDPPHKLLSPLINATANAISELHANLDWDFSKYAQPTWGIFSRITKRLLLDSTILYRGSRSTRPKRNTAWFSLDAQTALGYIVPQQTSTVQALCKEMGRVSAFKPINDVLLLDLSDIKSINYIKSQITDPKVLSCFSGSWNIDPKTKAVVRISTMWCDLAWTKWLCEQGYDGYIANRVENFHAEVFFCEWNKHLQYLGTYSNSTVLQYEFCKEPYFSTDCVVWGG